MSIKTRAFLLDASRSRLEGAYLTEGASMVLSNVPCEMTYKAEQMFIEHEDERHHFLPVVHMTGKVLELKGKFPFNVSTLYFSIIWQIASGVLSLVITQQPALERLYIKVLNPPM